MLTRIKQWLRPETRDDYVTERRYLPETDRQMIATLNYWEGLDRGYAEGVRWALAEVFAEVGIMPIVSRRNVVDTIDRLRGN